MKLPWYPHDSAQFMAITLGMSKADKGTLVELFDLAATLDGLEEYHFEGCSDRIRAIFNSKQREDDKFSTGFIERAREAYRKQVEGGKRGGKASVASRSGSSPPSSPPSSEGSTENSIEEKNIKTKPKDLSFQPEHLELAELLKSLILANNPSANIKDSQLPNWADIARLMFQRDNRTFDGIKAVMEWSQQDSFWKANCQSMQTLRDQYDKLYMKMQSEIPERESTIEEREKVVARRRAENKRGQG